VGLVDPPADPPLDGPVGGELAGSRGTADDNRGRTADDQADGGIADTDVARISYAQNFEDVRLWKALGDLSGHLYVDVGAGHPTRSSVTKLFSERDWTGINVEPGPNFARLAAERPRDVNVEAAVTTTDGSAPFVVAHPHPDLSSLHRAALEADPVNVESSTTVTVATTRLDTLLRRHAGDLPLGFLKVDVEGAEEEVLRSNDWDRFRPLVVVVEAIAPGTHEPAFASWEPILAGAGYRFAVDDGINRFYARADQRELRERLARPVSPIDGYVPWPLLEALQSAETAQAQRREAVARQQEAIARQQVAVAREHEAVAREHEAVARRQDLAQAFAGVDEARRRLQAQLDGSLVVALERDRALKEATVALRDARSTIARHVDANIALIDEVRDWKVLAARLDGSWAMRIGRRAAFRARRYERLVGPPARFALARVRSGRVRPDLVRSTLADMTACGQPLETIRTIEAPPVTKPAGGQAVDGLDGVQAVWRQLAARRADGPSLLTGSEWDRIIAAGGGRGDLEMPRGLTGLLALRRTPRPQAARGAARTTLVVDVTAAQIPAHCGTRSHALQVLDEVLRAVPSEVRVQAWSSDRYPPLAPDLLERFDGEWDPSGDPTNLAEVGALLQLAPFLNDDPEPLTTLLASPHVRSATVWLDAILGQYPHAFLRSAEAFFGYQFGLECVARHDWVLSLSRSCGAEVVAAGVPAERVLTTGCRPALAGMPEGARPAGLPFERHVLVVGNALPHKNVAAAVAGFAKVIVEHGGDLGVVVAADVNAEQADELVELAARLGVERHRVVVRPQVPAPTFAALVARADVTVVPSYHEGFSLPVIESTGAGTPVAVSDIPAHRELLGDGPWWFDADDPVDLARAVLDVLADPGPVLDAQRRQLTQRLDPERFARTLKQVVGDLCEGMAPSAGPRERGGLLPGQVAPLGGSSATSPQPAQRSLSLAKICEVEDFADPRLEPVIAEVFAHEKLRFGPDFPRGREYRKYWEVAMAILTFGEAGLLDGRRRFLGIGAGNEPTVFHLTHHAALVLATDLYLTPGWEESANGSMLTDPGAHWPLPWVPERLRVEHMDALDLRLPDASVAGVFSSSSIEHFGDRDAVARALDECHRVLEPGGVLSLSSEFRLRGDRPGIPGALLFDADDVAELFVGDRGWELVEPFDARVSPATVATASSFAAVAADQQAQVAKLGGLWTHHITYRRYPHIVLTTPDHDFTSFHLALRKHR
jgi:FkbM family methyltransferase